MASKRVRRDFLQNICGAAAGVAATPSLGAQDATRKPVRIGLIGCGARGTQNAQTAAQLGKAGEDTQITAVCDIYQPRLERVSTQFSARPYTIARGLTRDPNVDAVIVATPDRHHIEHALEAIRAGKDVYCEKPVAHWQQFEQLKELVHEVRQSGRVFQMGTQRLADPIWKQAAELIKRGEIGKPAHVQMGYCRRGDSGERGMPIDDPQAKPGVGLDWEAFLGDAPRRPFSVNRFFQWRLYMDYSGGPCTDNNVHFVALMVKALGVNFPVQVVALGGKYAYAKDAEREVPDTFDMVAQYAEGLNLTFMGTYANDTPVETVIRGTKGSMRFQEAGLISEPLAGVPHSRREIPHLKVGIEHMRDFLRCVRTRERPQGDIDLAYHVTTMLIMAMRSYVERKVASFDPEREQIRLG
jgi:predicted dehydrogenase